MRKFSKPLNASCFWNLRVLSFFRLYPLVLCLLFLTTTIELQSQKDYSKPDSIAYNFNRSNKSLKDLAEGLSASLDSDEDKARSIFMWIAKNVSYDVKKFRKPPTKPNFNEKSQSALQKRIEQWEMDQISKTIKSRKGICYDYSSLFKALCDEIGVESVIIVGQSRNFYSPFRAGGLGSHAWNAVKIDDRWHLLDATWAAGFVENGGKKFTRKISPGYFLTPPDWFVQTHLPDDEAWQLLDSPVSKKDFSSQPLVNFGQDDYSLKAFSKNVNIENGKLKEIWFEFNELPAAIQLVNSRRKPIKFQKKIKGNKMVLSFTSNTRMLEVYAGKSQRSKMDWLAKFQL